MNKAILMGRLTKDPDVRYTSGDNSLAIARYTLAVDRKIKRDGQYLVTFKKNTKVYIAEYGICQMPVTVLGQPIGCGWYSSTGYYYAEDSIVAWRPLPEPYKENEKREID